MKCISIQLLRLRKIYTFKIPQSHKNTSSPRGRGQESEVPRGGKA